MEIRRLVYFVKIAHLGSLRRAADYLRIAQPALTRQVRLLEEEIGVTLFQRSRKGMTLSAQGKQLLDEVLEPLRQMDQAVQNVKSSSTGLCGTIALGIPPTTTCMVAQPLLKRLTAAEPNLNVKILEGSAEHLTELLLKGELDMAFLFGPCPDDRLRDRELLAEELVVVGSGGSGLTAECPVKFAQVAAMPLILPGLRNGIRGVMERHATRLKLKLNVRFSIDSLSLVKDMVSAGSGVTVLPLSAVQSELSSGVFSYARISDRLVSRTLILAARGQCRMPQIMTMMDIHIQRQVTELVLNGDWPAKLLLDILPELPSDMAFAAAA
jgi:LysR family nitrogen assimilation transcriptional regulator